MTKGDKAAELLRKQKQEWTDFLNGHHKSLGFLIVGLINDHFPHPEEDNPADDDPQMGTHGCVLNCGPCGALHWFASYPLGREEVESYIRATGYHEGGWCYWDSESDHLRWGWFAQWWGRHKACWTNGTESGCFRADDREDQDSAAEVSQ